MKGFLVTRAWVDSYNTDDGHGCKHVTTKVSAIICELCVLLYVPSACNVAELHATTPDSHPLSPIGKCARCGQQIFDESIPLPSFPPNEERKGR